MSMPIDDVTAATIETIIPSRKIGARTRARLIRCALEEALFALEDHLDQKGHWPLLFRFELSENPEPRGHKRYEDAKAIDALLADASAATE